MNLTAKQQLSRNPSNAGYATPLKTYSVPATENPDGTINVPAQPVYGIDPNHEPIDGYMAVRMVPGGSIRWVVDALANDSDKSFTVPANKRWDLMFLTAQLTASATVGNRSIIIYVTNGTDIIWKGFGSAAIVAAQNGTLYCDFGNGAFRDTNLHFGIANTSIDVSLTTWGPRMVLPAGYVVRVFDLYAVDVAADDMTVAIEYVEYDA